ncbi:N-acetylmuramic acid 6-phosphate etherase [Georgenia halophila]|uniref:N-acetylmuramic acid 6-phosphate etherase n=1 Tax=Georgenia halophila TaxID=620889 RepID=A0ABP8LAS3_9MICO
MTPAHPATEGRNPRTLDIDAVPSAEALEMVLREDAVAIDASRAAVPELARLVDRAVERLQGGGQIHYAGAGASGRLAVLDATETTPTFGVDPELIHAHFPGGASALVDSTIDLEDAFDQGRLDLADVAEVDLVIGVTASGHTAYVRGALQAARTIGAATALVTSNRESPIAELADIVVAADTGPEALTGSTRLKAGTATKVILNAFSTAVMIGTGRSYSNLMVGLVASNEKLRQRSTALLTEATGRPQPECQEMLAECSGRLPLALTRMLSGVTGEAAEEALARGGSVRSALRLVQDGRE